LLRKKNYWVSLDPETGTKLELHRFNQERDSEFCRRIIRRFFSENPKIDCPPTNRGVRGPKGWEYEWRDQVEVGERLTRANTTLKQVFTSVAKLPPIKPIENQDEVLEILKGEFGKGFVPLTEVIGVLQLYISVRAIDSPGRMLLSELQSQGKLKLRRFDWMTDCKYVSIGGRMYTHIELLSPVYLDLARLPKSRILEMFRESESALTGSAIAQ